MSLNSYRVVYGDGTIGHFSKFITAIANAKAYAGQVMLGRIGEIVFSAATGFLNTPRPGYCSFVLERGGRLVNRGNFAFTFSHAVKGYGVYVLSPDDKVIWSSD